MIVVGLTGGIASGKSFVINYLKRKKIPTHESDLVVSKMYKKPSKDFLSYLKKNGFSNSITNNKINKKIIRDTVFKNKNKKIILEKFIHKKTKSERKIFINKNRFKKIVFLDVPLLFEKKLDKEFDFICSTITSTAKREKRALARGDINKKIIRLIIKSQTNDKTRKSRSDYIINTSGSKNKTYLQVDNIIYDILSKL